MADIVNAFFKKFYPPADKLAKAEVRMGAMGCAWRPVEGFSTIFPRMTCADGFSMSAQGHAGAYSQPRDDWADDYREVEVGFPSEREDLLMPFVEDESRPTQTVYGYVPIDIVEAVIAKHGGMAEADVS